MSPLVAPGRLARVSRSSERFRRVDTYVYSVQRLYCYLFSREEAPHIYLFT